VLRLIRLCGYRAAFARRLIRMTSVAVQAETSASSAAAGGAKITRGFRVAARQRTTIVLRSVGLGGRCSSTDQDEAGD